MSCVRWNIRTEITNHAGEPEQVRSVMSVLLQYAIQHMGLYTLPWSHHNKHQICLTPLCQDHYKQIYPILHANDGMSPDHPVTVSQGETVTDSYIDRMELYLLANQIDVVSYAAVLLRVVEVSNYSLLHDFISTSPLPTLAVLKGKFSTKPLTITERFKFECRYQK